MFLPSKFYIHKENDHLIEFREKKSKLYAGCLVLIAMGLVYIIMTFSAKSSGNPETDHWARMILIGVGVGHMLIGGIPMLTVGKILIDKNQKYLLFSGGIRKFYLSPVKVTFSEISHLEIKEVYYGRYGLGSTWDKVILKLNKRNAIELDRSRNDEYVNEMIYKISQSVECKVYHDNL